MQGKRYDTATLIVVFLLVTIGLVLLYSTSAYNGQVKFHDSFYYLKKQGFATALGLCGMFLIAGIDYHKCCLLYTSPEVVIYVVIDEPNVPDQESSRYILDLTHEIMAKAFPYLNISTIDGYVPQESMPTTEPADTVQEQEYVDFDAYYEDTYSVDYDNYVDDNYDPDLDDWATGIQYE